MRVRVLLFAAYREIVGQREVELEVSPGTTLEGVFDVLAASAPALSALRGSTTFAVNREVAAPQRLVAAGDEIALLQPVSGGMG